METRLVEVQKLKKFFPIKGGVFSTTVAFVKAVDEIDFFVNQGETLGLVGESGSGKTTAGRTMLKLLQPTGGKIIIRARTLRSLRQMRCGPCAGTCRSCFRIRMARSTPVCPSAILSRNLLMCTPSARARSADRQSKR